MGVPYGIVLVGYVLVALALLFAWLVAPDIADHLPASLGARSEPDLRTRSVVRGIGAVALALVASPFVLILLGAPLRPDEQPLVFGDQSGGTDPDLLQIIDTGNDQRQFTYAFQPGAEIKMGITLANTGSVPLTVTGVGPPTHPIYVRDYRFLLPQGGPTQDLPALYPGFTLTWASEPFHPFEIPANSEVGVGLAVDLTSCPDLKAVPTLAPGASFIPNDDSFTYTTGFGAADIIQVDYAAFGISRTATITLPDYMNVATGNASTDLPPNCPEP